MPSIYSVAANVASVPLAKSHSSAGFFEPRGGISI